MANPIGYELLYAKAPPKPKHEVDEAEAISNMISYANEAIDERARSFSICDIKLRQFGRPWHPSDIIILQNELRATFRIKKLPDQVVQVLKERCQ